MSKVNCQLYIILQLSSDTDLGTTVSKINCPTQEVSLLASDEVLTFTFSMKYSQRTQIHRNQFGTHAVSHAR